MNTWLEEKISKLHVKLATAQGLGSHEVALAKLFGETLVDVFRGAAISEGQLWLYNDQTGLWFGVEDSTVHCWIQHFDITYGGPLRLGAKKIGGIRQNFYNGPLCSESFFHTPARGIAFTNCVLTVGKNGVQRQNIMPEHRLRVGLPFKYVGGREPTKWLELFDSVFVDDPDKNEKVQLIREFIGACLLGAAPLPDRTLMFLGGGSNGKTVIIEALRLLFPQEAVATVPPQKWHKDDYLAKLNSKLLNCITELPTSAILANDVFKAVVSGDTINARKLYGVPFDFKPTAGHIFALNELPPTKDHTEGFWRRFLMIPFNQSFVDGEKTREEIINALRSDIPAAVEWALIGAAQLIKRGSYVIPVSHRGQLDQWKELADSVTSFARSHLLPLLKPANTDADWIRNNCFKGSDLYVRYRDWCREQGGVPCSNPVFGKRLSLLKFSKTRIQEGWYWSVRVHDMGDQAAPAVGPNV